MRVSTRTPEQKMELARVILLDNGGCDLPCWWAITPGKTAWSRLEEEFEQRGMPLTDGTVVLSLPPEKRYESYNLGLYFTQSDGKVGSINVRVEDYAWPGTTSLARDWVYYSVPATLTRYGVPSAVLVANLPAMEKGDVSMYGLTLVYGDSGFSISYYGLASLVPGGRALRACPSLELVRNIRLRTEAKTPLVIEADPEYMVYTLENATGMTPTDFYDTYAEGDTQSCMTIPFQ